MGGNATKHLGTERISKENYILAYSEIKILFKEYLEKKGLYDEKFGDIPYFESKQDFGDMDFLSTIPINIFDEFINGENVKRNGIKVIEKINAGGGVNCFAIEFNKNNKNFKFQFDYIYANPKYYDFMKNYFSYNDLGNLVGRVASAYGYKFGHDGLFKRFYFKESGDISKIYSLKSISKLENKNNENDKGSFKEYIFLTDDFDKALEFLGFNKDRFKDGFKTKQEIFDYVITSKYFDNDFFELENRNNKQRVRDRKRSTYNEFLEYIKDKDIKNEEYSISKQKLLNKERKDFPHLNNELIKLRKEIKTSFFVQKRLSLDKIDNIMKKNFNISFTKNPEWFSKEECIFQDNQIHVSWVKGIQNKIKEKAMNLNNENWNTSQKYKKIKLFKNSNQAIQNLTKYQLQNIINETIKDFIEDKKIVIKNEQEKPKTKKTKLKIY